MKFQFESIGQDLTQHRYHSRGNILAVELPFDVKPVRLDPARPTHDFKFLQVVAVLKEKTECCAFREKSSWLRSNRNAAHAWRRGLDGHDIKRLRQCTNKQSEREAKPHMISVLRRFLDVIDD